VAKQRLTDIVEDKKRKEKATSKIFLIGLIILTILPHLVKKKKKEL